MNNFKQLIRFENQKIHKQQILDFVGRLEIKEDVEYECVIKPYKKNKTLEQLGYYFSTVVPVAAEFQGLTLKYAHEWLKQQCCERVYFSTLDGESHEFMPSIAKMKINVMSKYIDDCINFLGIHGQYVPPPHYNNE